MTQLAQGLGLDLADAFTGDVEELAHFFQGMVALFGDTETLAQHLLLARGQIGQHGRQLFGQLGIDDFLGGGHGLLVLDEIAQAGIFLVADGRFQRDGLLGDLEHLLDLFHRVFHAFGDLFGRGIAAQFLHQVTRGADELVDGLDHVHRDADGASLVRDGAGDGLTDPPGGVGGELVAALVLELVHGLHEADVAFLDEVQELEAAVGVLLGDADHEAQVGADELLLGAHGGGVAAPDAPQHFFQIVDVVAALFLQAAQDLDLADDHFLEGEELVHAELEVAGGIIGIDGALLEAGEHLLDLGLGTAGGQDVGRKVALAVVHLAHVVLDRFDDAVDEGLFQLDVAQAGDDLFLVADDLLLDGGHLAVKGVAVVQLFVDLALFLEDLLDLVQQQDDAGALVELVFAGIVFFDGLDHVLELDAVLAQVFAHVDELFHGHGHFHQGVEHVLFAHLDLFGDDHFAVAIQQGHGAHLAQVHAHRIGAARGIVGGFFVFGQLQGAVHGVVVGFGGRGGDFFAVLFGIDDGDLQLLKDADDLLELLGGVHLHGKGFVDLVEGQVAHALALGDEALNLLDIFKIAHVPAPRFPAVREDIPNQRQSRQCRCSAAGRPSRTGAGLPHNRHQDHGAGLPAPCRRHHGGPLRRPGRRTRNSFRAGPDGRGPRRSPILRSCPTTDGRCPTAGPGQRPDPADRPVGRGSGPHTS